MTIKVWRTYTTTTIGPTKSVCGNCGGDAGAVHTENSGKLRLIRNTLAHMMSTEWGWLDRCGGTRRGSALKGEDYPTLESIMTQWSKVEEYVRQFFSTLNDADLLRNVEYVNERGKRSMPIGELLHHGVNHAVHHRGQLALLLRMLGYTPGNFDILFYYGEKRGVSAW